MLFSTWIIQQKGQNMSSGDALVHADDDLLYVTNWAPDCHTFNISAPVSVALLFNAYINDLVRFSE